MPEPGHAGPLVLRAARASSACKSAATPSTPSQWPISALPPPACLPACRRAVAAFAWEGRRRHDAVTGMHFPFLSRSRASNLIFLSIFFSQGTFVDQRTAHLLWQLSPHSFRRARDFSFAHQFLFGTSLAGALLTSFFFSDNFFFRGCFRKSLARPIYDV